MVSATAYVLKVPEHRREILLSHRHGWFSPKKTHVAEPVPVFDHSRKAPLIVLACFEEDAITHIASGRKGASAGTDLVRLNMESIERLESPVEFGELLDRAPSRIRVHLRRALSGGGTLPPKTLGAVVDILLALLPGLTERLARFSEQRAESIRRLTDPERENLAIQKESLAVALKIAQLETDQLHAWSPVQARVNRSFLEGMPGAYIREDAAIISDFSTVPGFEAIQDLPFAAKVFESPTNPSLRLTVIMANRLPLEQQTGADLIYYNEAYRSFVLVQYKSMQEGKNGAEFRWKPDDQLASEIRRMDTLLKELSRCAQDTAPDSFRLHRNPFFLKLCPRVVFNPDDKSLIKGMYLPLDFWKCLASDSITEGPRGGRLLTFENVGRKLNNSEFVAMVANAWIGTTAPQSALLAEVIRSIIETGKTVTLAVKADDRTTQHEWEEDHEEDGWPEDLPGDFL